MKFTVIGIPVPQGSMKAFMPKNARFPIVTSDNPKLKQWRQTVRAAAIRAMDFDLPAKKNVPIRIEATFFLPKARSNKSLDAVKRPDLDKLCRAILDAMTGIVFADDSQVTEIHAFKDYGSPRVEVEVGESGIVAAIMVYENNARFEGF